MSRIYNPISMNDAKPILKPSNNNSSTSSSSNYATIGDELELQTMVRHTVVEGQEEYVSVTAPTNLPAGYELIVDIMDGSFWTVQVPDGGVAMNETFRAKVLHKTHVAKAELVDTAQQSLSKSDPLMNMKNASNHQQQQLQFDIPTGRWRDGIFDCCIIPVHPVFFLTYCWPLITLGQVMTRIKFNVCGGCDNRSNRTCPRAFYIMLTITIVNMVFQVFFSGVGQVLTLLFSFGTMFGMGNNLDAATAYNPYAFAGSSNTGSGGGGGAGTGLSDDLFASIFNGTTLDDDQFLQIIQQQQQSQISNTTSGPAVAFLGMGLFQIILMLSLFIFILVVHTETRNRIRRTYSIGSNTFCLGDCCCAFWCGACSICQMARHTANYHNTHRARCCTPTGLDEEWDEYDFLTVAQNGPHHRPRSVIPMMV